MICFLWLILFEVKLSISCLENGLKIYFNSKFFLSVWKKIREKLKDERNQWQQKQLDWHKTRFFTQTFQTLLYFWITKE
jgi:hypothetical protein